MILKNKTIAVCVTGGIAVYKSCEIVSRLMKLGADVHVVMTHNATNFVTPLTFETLSGNKVILENFDPNREWEVEHVSLAKKCNLFLVAPCTANVVGKLASGIADDFLTTCLMATTAPIVIAPAMNVNMYNSAAYQNNQKLLIERGFGFIEPDCGLLACGDIGKGRLAEPYAIVEHIVDILAPNRDFDGKTVLVALGATKEAIDPVRYITNNSSGKMGCAIIDAALERGANVIAVCGSVKVNINKSAEVYSVDSTLQMYNEMMRLYKNADYIIMAAAPSDYRVLNYCDSKIKADVLTLNLQKNVDIAAEIGKIKEGRKLVAFAAETENLIENAKAKRIKKNADLIVANDVTAEGAGFNVDTNIATLITENNVIALDKMTKKELAHEILNKIRDVR